MFELMTDRIAGTVLMGLDVAVEFATLGEYRLVEVDLAPAPDSFNPLPLVRRPERLGAVAADHQLLPPASTAIARAAAESAARVATRRKGQTPALADALVRSASRRGKAVVPSAPRRRSAAPMHTSGKPHPRSRQGAVESATQLCLFDRHA